jgi:hypothetical protein
MGQVASLGEVIDTLFELEVEDTIYVSEPWTAHAQAIVAREPDSGGLPAEVSNAGMKYFLEVGIAQEFVKDWLASLKEPPTLSDVRQRVIDYAINDA